MKDIYNKNFFQKLIDFGVCEITRGEFIVRFIGVLMFWLFFFVFAWGLWAVMG